MTIELVASFDEAKKKTTEKSFLIIDEIDHQLLDCRLELPKARMTLGLSATPFESFTGVERRYLEHKLRADVHDSGIATKDSDIPDVTPVNDLDSFFRDTDEDNSKLIYAKASLVPLIRQAADAAGYPEPITNCHNLQIVSSVGKRVLIVTPDHKLLMRGTDYRSEHIDLLLMHSFDNERDYR